MEREPALHESFVKVRCCAGETACMGCRLGSSDADGAISLNFSALGIEMGGGEPPILGGVQAEAGESLSQEAMKRNSITPWQGGDWIR